MSSTSNAESVASPPYTDSDMKGFPSIAALALYTCQSLASPVSENGVHDMKARQPPPCGDPSDAVPLLRAFRNNFAATTHYYSIDPSQMEAWIAAAQGQSQGDAALVFGTQQPSNSPVYAFHNGQDADFICTASSNEVSTLVAEGWQDGGILWYAYTSQICDSIPFYVVDNPITTGHLYTTNITERDAAISSQGYVDEGIAMYVLPFTD
ncbi:hypothetical protein EWM64_g6171 [Hericium alpestre]|uniref:DUF5648 domain-containing protein n=1 Tax=Hericium alpestre TaxID=135208 RepID=A0A4Y9ZVD8_9AGAM|nr:hypothetical protein EWM64_g6171 [Hericium alpestre]